MRAASMIAVDDAGRPSHAIDPFEHEAWRLRWDGARLVHARVRLPGGDALELLPGTADHLLLGPCDAVHHEGHDEPIARIAAVSWHAPTCIPAVDVPGALPPGAGTVILNLLAALAEHSGATSLRYRGPYPTSALFATLAASFRITGDRDAAERRFVHDDGFGLHDIEPDVDFVPDPHAWSWPLPRVCVQHRRGTEAVWIDARAYAPGATNHVLVRDGDAWSARVVLAGEPWCEVLRVDDRGEPCSAIATPPAAPPHLVGITLPTAMVEVIRDVVIRASAPALAASIARVLAGGITLADTGLTVARAQARGIVLSAALVERAMARDGATSLAILALALRPIVARTAVARLLEHI